MSENPTIPEEPIPRQPAMVLVVEDEEALRKAISKALRRRGMTVMEAGDGLAALDLVRAHAHEIDVILLDMSLPGAPSRDIFKEARHLHPDLKIILTSAHPIEEFKTSLAGLRFERFIRKPFHLAELIALFEELSS